MFRRNVLFTHNSVCWFNTLICLGACHPVLDLGHCFSPTSEYTLQYGSTLGRHHSKMQHDGMFHYASPPYAGNILPSYIPLTNNDLQILRWKIIAAVDCIIELGIASISIFLASRIQSRFAQKAIIVTVFSARLLSVSSSISQKNQNKTIFFKKKI